MLATTYLPPSSKLSHQSYSEHLIQNIQVVQLIEIHVTINTLRMQYKDGLRI